MNKNGEQMVYAVGIWIWSGLVILSFCSRKEQGRNLWRISRFVYKKMSRYGLRRANSLQNMRVKQRLMALQPGTSAEKLQEDYYAEKIREMLIVLIVGSIAAGCVDLAAGSNNLLQKEVFLMRPDTAKTVTLNVHVRDQVQTWSEQLELEIGVKELTKEEACLRYEEFIPALEQKMLGENLSFQQVRCSLQLPSEIEEFPFWVEWKSSDPKLLSTDGSINAEDLQEPAQILLTAMIYYGDNEWEKSWNIVLYPPGRTPEEQALYDLKILLETAENEQRYEDKLLLPTSLGDWSLSWEEEKDSAGKTIMLLTLGAAGLVFYMKDWDLQKDLEKRRRCMAQEYGIFVNRYALLLEAGMTVRGAFLKICGDNYENKKKHPLYQEMNYSCNELKAGISEHKVYENFGRRIGLQEYTRLCSLLNQNLKKGNTALARRLKEEGEDALAENLRWEKRLGEEAGTKLLAPMGMMLIMVLVMIILPAFSGIGM